MRHMLSLYLALLVFCSPVTSILKDFQCSQVSDVAQWASCYNNIVIVIDTSQSVDQADLVDAIDFVYNVTEWLNVGSNDILISIVTFSTDVTEQFPLSSYNDKTSLLAAIKSLTSVNTGGATYTFDALTYVKTTSFLTINGGRSSALKAVLVMTDGKSSNYPLTKSEADEIRNTLSAEVFAIGIGAAAGSVSNIEIPAIASDPDDYYTYYVKSYEVLCSLIPSIVPKLDPDAVAQGVADCPTEETTTVTPDASANGLDVSMLVGIVVAVVILAVVVTILSATLAQQRKIPKVGTMEQQTLNAVKQYQEAPMGQEKNIFDTSQLDIVPSTGPRGEFAMFIPTPSASAYLRDAALL